MSGGMVQQESRRNGKSEAAFRTISEVAEELDIPQHVLRFWETKFGQIRPMKRGGGRRYYRPEDVALLRRIRGLLYDDGFTIKGVQKLLKDGAVKAQPAAENTAAQKSATVDIFAAAEARAKSGQLDDRSKAEIRGVVGELAAVRDMLRSAASS